MQSTIEYVTRGVEERKRRQETPPYYIVNQENNIYNKPIFEKKTIALLMLNLCPRSTNFSIPTFFLHSSIESTISDSASSAFLLNDGRLLLANPFIKI